MCAWFVLSNKNQHSFFQPFLSSKNKVTRHTAWHNEKNITSEEVQIPFCTQNPLTRSVILLLHSFINVMLSAAEQVLQKMNHCKCSTGWEWNKTFLIQSQWILMVNHWKVLICTTAKPKTFTNAVYSTVLLFSFPRPSLPWQHQWLQDRLVLAGKHDPGGAGRFWVGEDPDPQRQSHLVPSAVDDLFAHWGPGSDRNQCILWNQLHWGPGPDRNQRILWNQVHWDPGSDRNQCKLWNQVHWGPGSDRNQCILRNKYTGALDQTETNAYCENKYTGVWIRQKPMHTVKPSTLGPWTRQKPMHTVKTSTLGFWIRQKPMHIVKPSTLRPWIRQKPMHTAKPSMHPVHTVKPRNKMQTNRNWATTENRD